MQKREPDGCSQDAESLVNELEKRDFRKPRFSIEARYAARLTCSLINKLGMGTGDVSIIDLGSGGKGQITYPPFFLLSLAGKGHAFSNLFGCDIHAQVDESAPFYQHSQFDLKAEIESILHVRTTSVSKLAAIVNRARESATCGRVIVSSNNLFCNTDLTLFRSGGIPLGCVFEVMEMLLKDGDYFLLFDAYDRKKVPVVSVKYRGRLRKSKVSDQFKVKFKAVALQAKGER